MKIKIAHLLHYYWDSPAIGFRIVHNGHCAGFIYKIPQGLSNILCNISDRYRGFEMNGPKGV